MACIFCNIVRGEVSATIVYQDDLVTAFRDINPKAPVHVLVVPNEHIPSVRELRAEHGALLARMFEAASRIAAQEQVAETGFRLVINNGPHAGQSVDHLHLHLLGGRPMAWPPG
jgi:histidine triad (HIT) family protein